MNLPAPELTAFVAALFVDRGMSEADARAFADMLVWAESRGTDSHGLSRMDAYLTMIDKGHIDPRAQPELRVDLGAVFSLDAKRGAGPVSMMRALDGARTRARAFGIGMGLVGRATHAGAIGYYAEKAARDGFAAIVLAAGPPIMAYHGARIASASTAPVAMAVPGGPDGAILLDMASSLVSNGRLKQARRARETIPETWALDADGRPTTDAEAAVIPLPMAGAKGAGLSLLIECLTSVLAAAPILSAMLGPDGKRAHVQNVMIILIDVARFRAVSDFTADIDTLAGVLHALPAIDSAQPVRLPGERGAKAAARAAREGVRIPEKLWRELTGIAAARGVPVPATA